MNPIDKTGTGKASENGDKDKSSDILGEKVVSIPIIPDITGSSDVASVTLSPGNVQVTGKDQSDISVEQLEKFSVDTLKAAEELIESGSEEYESSLKKVVSHLKEEDTEGVLNAVSSKKLTKKQILLGLAKLVVFGPFILTGRIIKFALQMGLLAAKLSIMELFCLMMIIPVLLLIIVRALLGPKRGYAINVSLLKSVFLIFRLPIEDLLKSTKLILKAMLLYKGNLLKVHREEERKLIQSIDNGIFPSVHFVAHLVGSMLEK